jgi:glycosyltransferase involved in cell wall biosynthesis
LKMPKTSKGILYPLPPLDKDKIDRFFKDNVIKNTLKIAIFGAVSPRKNQMEALQAAKLLKDRGVTNFTIDLYGDKEANIPYTKTLRRFIADNSLKENVKIKGFTTNVYEKMNEYNVVLSTATYEPFGRTIIEGQLYGRIAITNDTGGGPELVEDSVNGLVYKLNDAEQLADKIAWVMDNKQAALQLGVNAKTGQFEKYITSTRYDALLDAITYFAERNDVPSRENIYDPMMCLFQYNHYLNNRYKHVYRLLHNRVTYKAKGVGDRLILRAKKVAKQILP